VTPEPPSLPSFGVDAEARSKVADRGSWPPAVGAKNPTAFKEVPLGCLRDAAGFSTAPPGSSPPIVRSRPSPSPCGLEGPSAGDDWAEKKKIGVEHTVDDCAETTKKKSDRDHPVFSGKCRYCGWEDRASTSCTSTR
jgi:hypothetical protein